MSTILRLAIAVLAVAFLLPPASLGAAASTAAAKSPLSGSVLTPAVDAYVESGPSWDWGSGFAYLETADPFLGFLPDGRMAHDYDEPRGNARFYIRNASTGLPDYTSGPNNGFFAPPVSYDDRDAPGPDFAVLGADKFVILGQYTGVGPVQLRYVVQDVTGATVVSQRAIGSPYLLSTNHASVATDPTGGFSVVDRSMLVIVTQDTDSLTYSRVAANSSVTVDHLRLNTPYRHYAYPQIAYDSASTGFVVSFEAFNDTGPADNDIMGIAANGSVRWGPLVLAHINGSVNITVNATGVAFALWGEGNTVLATVLDTSGRTLAWRQTAVGGAPNARCVRPFNISEGDVGVVWEDTSFNGAGDIRLAYVRDLLGAAKVDSVYLTADTTEDAFPRAAQGPTGDTWTMWVKRDSPTSTWQQHSSDVRLHFIPFEVEAPPENLTVARGDTLDVPFTIRNTAAALSNFSYNTSLSFPQGPANWSISLTDASNGQTTVGASLPAGALQNLSIGFQPPLVDPPGYAARFTLLVSNVDHPESNVTFTVNVTVIVGHRLEIAPGISNATGLPGTDVVLPFTVLNNGTLAESGASLTLQVGPPSLWIAQLEPSNITLDPGDAANVTLRVSIPANASSLDSYCSVVRVASLDPLFRPGASFCARAALVSTPRIGPPLQSLLVDPGGFATSNLTATNVGNAAVALTCTLLRNGTVPSSWSVVGTDWTAALVGGAAANFTLSFYAPADAPGAANYSLSISVVCGGFLSTAPAIIALEVREVHQVTWRFPGSRTQAGADGLANFAASLRNDGNVAEVVGFEVLDLLPAWSADLIRTSALPGDLTVAPFSTADFTLALRVASRTPAASYSALFRFSTASGATRDLAVTVDVPVTFGLTGSADPLSLVARPGETASLRLNLTHDSNSNESFALTVVGNATGSVLWQTAFAASDPGDGSSAPPGSLLLAPFSSGALWVNLSIPWDPQWSSLGLRVTLKSVHGSYGSWNFSVKVILPDLAVEVALGNLSSSETGAAASFQVRVTNAGDDAAASVEVRLALDGATFWTSETGPLGVGAARTFEVTQNVSYGNHTVRALVDPVDAPGANPVSGALYESNESNNSAVLAFEAVQRSAPPPPEPQAPSSPSTGALPFGLILGVAVGVACLATVALLKRRKGGRTPPQ